MKNETVNMLIDENTDKIVMEEKKNNIINVLMLSLSTFSFDKSIEKYKVNTTSFKYGEEEYIGRYQLDPVPKILSKKLGEKEEHLDYIIALCAKRKDDTVPEVAVERDVSVPIGTDENGKDIHEVISISPIEYFKCQIGGYLYKKNEDQDRVIRVDIDEDSPVKGIKEAINKIHNIEISENGNRNEVNLYLDTHGGFRDIQLIVQAIVSLLGKEEISVKESFSVKYGKGHNDITSDKSMEMFDFASGINEFINYGRLTSLNSFINKNIDNFAEAGRFIEILQKISDSISICNTADFEEGINDLSHYCNEENSNSGLGYLLLFIETIKNDFGDLLKPERTVVDEIKWCLRKQYFQQALTLIESKMPGEFVRNGLRFYCNGENINEVINVYNAFYNRLPNREKWKIKDPAHFFIKYYDMSKNSVNITDELNKLTLYPPEVNNDIDNVIKLYKDLCDLRNSINHGNVRNTTVEVIKEKIEHFISKYEDVLLHEHNNCDIYEVKFDNSSNVFYVQSGEWKNEIIPDSLECSDGDKELLKKIIYTFRIKGYENNTQDYTKVRSDVMHLCNEDNSILGKGSLKKICSVGKCIFSRDDDKLTWNSNYMN